MELSSSGSRGCPGGHLERGSGKALTCSLSGSPPALKGGGTENSFRGKKCGYSHQHTQARDKVFQPGYQKFPRKGSPETWAMCTPPFPLSLPLSPRKVGRGFQPGSRFRKERHSLCFCLWRSVWPSSGARPWGVASADPDSLSGTQHGGWRGAPR